MIRLLKTCILCSLIFFFSMTVQALAGGNCSGTSTNLVPISELNGLYLGHRGLLYDGSNLRPQALTAAAPSIRPIDGKIVVASLGMSNTAQEFDAFLGLAALDETINPNVQLVNMAASGCPATSTANPDNRCWSFFENNLRNAGVSFNDVQVIWLKSTGTTRGSAFPESSDWLLRDLRETLDVARARMPNLKQVYVSSRIYAGYANVRLDPEPHAYETAFAFRELVQSQHPGLWISWGPYLWADGLNVRSDGLFWICDDFQNDGTHPSLSGSLKVAHLLMDFFKSDRVARRWFLADGSPEPEPNPDPGPGDVSGLVQDLIDAINSQSIRISDVVRRLEEIRDLLVEQAL